MYLCDELLVSNENGLPLRVVGGDEEIPGTLNIDLMTFQVAFVTLVIVTSF